MPLQDEFGRIDIYLFDQLLRGRITGGMRILDAGCGDGRNLVYLLRAGHDVYGIDRDPAAIERVRATAAALAPQVGPERFQVADVRSLPFDDAFFDVVISSAVLHFAKDPQQFDAMLGEQWRVLAGGGLFWARLASSIGIEDRIEPLGNGRYGLPDGTDRFLVDQAMLEERALRLSGEPVDPLKTTNVQNLRCMTTWCLRKSISGEPC